MSAARSGLVSFGKNADNEKTIHGTKGVSQCNQEYLLHESNSDCDVSQVSNYQSFWPFDEVDIGVYLSKNYYFWKKLGLNTRVGR